MSRRLRVANFAAIFASAAIFVGAVPAGRATGATLSPDAVEAIQPPASIIEPLKIETPAPLIVAATVVEATPASLSDLVLRNASSEAADSELKCLATAVYFESKGEPLAGQLAVAHVVMNRAGSGRFAKTLCGVVKQPSQFSFVRGGGFPPIQNAAQWRKAVGVAQVAMKGLHNSAAPGALFFHAKRVSPNWGKRRVASVGNHIFYR